jgi:hypothetical protein
MDRPKGRAVDEDPEERFRRTIRFADLARELAVDLPPFRGPLEAFDPVPGRSSSDPVYLGGDLHAVHPDGGDPDGTPSDPDESLDQATITLLDGEGWALDIQAIEGIWCTRLEGAALECAPYLSLADSEGRIRTWLLLPPPHLMLGIGHYWLPSVPGLGGSRAAGPGPPRGQRSD